MRSGRNMHFKGTWSNVKFKGYAVDTQDLKSIELSMGFWMDPSEDAPQYSKDLFRKTKKLIQTNKADYYYDRMIAINDTPVQTQISRIYVRYIFNLYLRDRKDFKPVMNDLIPLCDELHQQVFKDANITKSRK